MFTGGGAGIRVHGTQCELLDSAGDSGLYPHMTDALSPMLYTLEFPTPTRYRLLAGVSARERLPG